MVPTPAPEVTPGTPEAAAASAAFQPGSREYGLYAGATAQPTQPAPAANANLLGTAPPDVGSGVPSGASIGSQLAGKSSPFVSSVMGHADAITQADPQAVAQPMGWARALVGGVQKTLSAGVGAMGDAAAVGTIPPGSGKLGGAMTGISRVLNARNERMAGEAKAKDAHEEHQSKLLNDKALMAESNARMLHEQALTHQIGQKAIDDSIDAGVKFVDLQKKQAIPAKETYTGLTTDEIHQRVKDGTLDPTVETAYPTGKKVISENADGTPNYRTTYTGLIPTSVTVGDPKDPEKDKAVLDRLNKFAPPADGTKWQPGQIFSGVQGNFVYQQASDNEASTKAAQKTLEDNEILDADRAQKLEVVRIGPEWNNALKNAANDPLRALAAMQANPAMVQKFPHLYSDVREAYGKDGSKYNLDTLIDQRQKKIEDQTDYLKKLEDDPAQMSGEKAAASVTMLQARLADPTTPPELKPRIQRLVNQAESAQTASQRYEESKERSKQLITDGDTGAGAKLLVDRTVAPSQLVSTRKPEYATEAYRKAKLLDPHFDAGVYEAQFNAAKAPSQSIFFGSANSLLDKAGTLDQLGVNYAKLPNGQIPKLNSIADWTAAQAGSGPISGFAATALGVADDYAKVMGGGQGSDTSRLQALDLIKRQSSPEGMKAAIQSIRDAVTSQTKSRMGKNPYLKSMYSSNFTETPGFEPAPPGATNPIYASDGKTLIGHAVNGVFVALGAK